jgi:hypothetical protein
MAQSVPIAASQMLYNGREHHSVRHSELGRAQMTEATVAVP